jgi:membrane associated rhomboid family serine protease
VLPLSDGIPARRFPFVNLALIGFFAARANGGGTAFFAHVGGFVFGLVAARLLTTSGVVGSRVRAGEPVGAGATP